jgi:hypothetical protein
VRIPSRTRHWSRRPIAFAPASLRLSGAAHRARSASMGALRMSLLHDIQSAVLEEGADLGPILLKLRLLAALLGSQPLADWVRHESEG